MDIPLDVSLPATSVEEVYRVHAARLWRSLVAWTGDGTIAEDAMAEAFAQALRRGAELRDPERWVWRAAFRIAAGALADRRRDQARTAEGVASDPAYELDEVPAALAEALRSLPEGQRAAIVLHYYADLRVRDVAEVLGTTSGAVKVALFRARRRLRSSLEASDA